MATIFMIVVGIVFVIGGLAVCATAVFVAIDAVDAVFTWYVIRERRRTNRVRRVRMFGHMDVDILR